MQPSSKQAGISVINVWSALNNLLSHAGFCNILKISTYLNLLHFNHLLYVMVLLTDYIKKTVQWNTDFPCLFYRVQFDKEIQFWLYNVIFVWRISTIHQISGIKFGQKILQTTSVIVSPTCAIGKTWEFFF